MKHIENIIEERAHLFARNCPKSNFNMYELKVMAAETLVFEKQVEYSTTRKFASGFTRSIHLFILRSEMDVLIEGYMKKYLEMVNNKFLPDQTGGKNEQGD